MIAREGQIGATSESGRSHVTNSHSTLEARNRKDERALDKDEEDYFNEDRLDGDCRSPLITFCMICNWAQFVVCGVVMRRTIQCL